MVCTEGSSRGGSMTSLSKESGRKRGAVRASSVSVTITSDVTLWQKFSFVTQSCCAGWRTHANQLSLVCSTVRLRCLVTSVAQCKKEMFYSGTLSASERSETHQPDWQLAVWRNIMTPSPSRTCNGNATIDFGCGVELHVTVNRIRILNCFYGEFFSLETL